ncbi:hypothetical protein J6590_032594 [Homalodisca vitripennis]|nr:hypothetical protein J6590_032594 [Homalodisca vitripennis]
MSPVRPPLPPPHIERMSERRGEVRPLLTRAARALSLFLPLPLTAVTTRGISVSLAMAVDWLRSFFGERLVRPCSVAGDPEDFCPVDILVTEKPVDESRVIGVYFRALTDLDSEDPSVKPLLDLYNSVNSGGSRLEVVQVFIPPWVGFRQCGDPDLPRMFRQSYIGVPWYTMPIDDEVKWVSMHRLSYHIRNKEVELPRRFSANPEPAASRTLTRDIPTVIKKPPSSRSDQFRRGERGTTATRGRMRIMT